MLGQAHASRYAVNCKICLLLVCYHGNSSSHSTAALKRMLNLNIPPSKSSVATEPVWKVGFGEEVMRPDVTHTLQWLTMIYSASGGRC